MENIIKLCGVEIGEVKGNVEVDGVIVMSKDFIILPISDLKLLHYISPVLRQGNWENRIITAAGNSDCNFSKIECNTYKGPIPNFPTIIQIGKCSYLKFEIYNSGIVISFSRNLEQWINVGLILKKKEVGMISVIREGDIIKMWFSHYDNHPELNYDEGWIISLASLNINKINEAFTVKLKKCMLEN